MLINKIAVLQDLGCCLLHPIFYYRLIDENSFNVASSSILRILLRLLITSWVENGIRRKILRKYSCVQQNENSLRRRSGKRLREILLCHLLSNSVFISKNLLFVSCFWNVRKYVFFSRERYSFHVWYPAESRDAAESHEQINNQTIFKFIFRLRWAVVQSL